jgi:hypothetical protein
VRVFRHALALDEVPSSKTEVGVSLTSSLQCRARFQPTQLRGKRKKDDRKPSLGEAQKKDDRKPGLGEVQKQDDHKPSPGEAQKYPDIQEVWFAGTHADVGGSAVEDDVPSLADITLNWMVEQVKDSKCGIKFKDEEKDLKAADVDAPIIELASPARHLASKGIHDKLKSQPLWWLLEPVPTKIPRHRKSGEWGSRWV